MRVLAKGLVACAVVIACTGKSGDEADTPVASATDSVTDTTGVQMPAIPGSTGPAKTGDPKGTVKKPPVTDPKSGGSKGTGTPTLPPSPQRKLTVTAILQSPGVVGQRVSVTGRCVGYSRPVAMGSAPRSRSDWQLEDGGSAIWVNGDFPPGCTGTTEGSTPVSIVAVVMEDSIKALGSSSLKPRRYLVRNEE